MCFKLCSFQLWSILLFVYRARATCLWPVLLLNYILWPVNSRKFIALTYNSKRNLNNYLHHNLLLILQVCGIGRKYIKSYIAHAYDHDIICLSYPFLLTTDAPV